MTGQWKDICNFSGEKTLLFSAKLLDHLWKERCSRFYFFFVVPSSVGAQKDGKNSGTRTLELLEETWCPGYQLGQTNGKPTWNLTMPKEKHRKKPSNFWGFHVYIHSKYDIYIYAYIYIHTYIYIFMKIISYLTLIYLLSIHIISTNMSTTTTSTFPKRPLGPNDPSLRLRFILGRPWIDDLRDKQCERFDGRAWNTTVVVVWPTKMRKVGI